MMRNKKSMSPLVCDTSKSSADLDYKCPDCPRRIHGHYQYGMHRAFKHDDWTVLEEWYLKHKGKVPWWVKG